MKSGYSERSLTEKLGMKANQVISIIASPDGFMKVLGKLPEGVTVIGRPNDTPVDFIHLFVTSKEVLEVELPEVKKMLTPNGSLWISWPKKSSKILTDLDETIIREIGLKLGLVDVKVVAVDEVWSGLKFVYRRKDRPK